MDTRMLEMNKIIAAVRSDEDFSASLDSRVGVIFDLSPDLMMLPQKIKRAHDKGKKLLIHIDLAKGIGKDPSGIHFISRLGVDGIISTKANLIRAAKDRGVFAVQRFFAVDSQSVQTTVETLKSTSPDVIEIMPGTVCKVVSSLNEKINIPIIAGGLVDSEKEVRAALQSGAVAVSTGNKQLWDMEF